MWIQRPTISRDMTGVNEGAATTNTVTGPDSECANANCDPDATLILHYEHLVELYKA